MRPRPRRSSNAARSSSASGGCAIALSPTASRKLATACSPSHGCRQVSGEAREQRTRSSVCTKSSSGGSRRRPCCHRLIRQRCCSGRCSPVVRSTCARLMVGRRLPPSPSISRLTSRPDRVLSKCRRSRHPIPTPLATAPPPPPSWLLAKEVEPERRASPLKGAIWASVLIFIVGILAVTLFLKPERMSFLLARTHLVQALVNIPPSKLVELTDWGSSWALETMGSLMAPVAQSAALYEEDPTDLRGIRYIGSVMWRSERPDDGSAFGLISLASIKIPELNMSVTIRFRRNADEALAETHIIEMMFDSADPAFGGIADVLDIMLKQSEEALGQRLAGVIKHASSRFFIVALSTTETDTRRNRELMKEQCWFDIAIVYTSGRRAILAFEKEKEAFARME